MYIKYDTREAAQAACREMDGESIAGSALHVTLVSPLPSRISSVGATSTAEVRGELMSIKLTNIPPSIDEASLLEKCRSLAGFSSLKLVTVKDTPTNYAWVNIRSSDANVVQGVLNGIVLDIVRASQPEIYCRNVTEQNVTEMNQQKASSDLPIRFSFKLSDNVGLSAPVPTGQPDVMGIKNFPNLPSESQSLFQPVRCGLDLSAAHRSMLSTLPVTTSGYPVPLNTQSSSKSTAAIESKVCTMPTTLSRSVRHTQIPLGHNIPPVIPCPTQRKKRKPKSDLSRLDTAPLECMPRELIVRIPREHYLRATQPLSLNQSRTQQLTLSEAGTLIDKEVSQGPYRKRVVGDLTSPLFKMRRAQTLPAATSVKSTHGLVSQSDKADTWKSKVSETGGDRGSSISRHPLLAIRHTQTTPAKLSAATHSLSKSLTKDLAVSPSSSHKGGSLSKEDSEGNPFKQALTRCTSPVPKTQKPAKSQTPPPILLPKKKPMVVSETVECSHTTSKRMMFSRHKRELEVLQDKFGVTLRGEEVEGAALSITGEKRSVHQVRDKITELEKSVQASISCATFTISCAFLPCLAEPDTVLSLQVVEKRNAVDFAVLGVNCQMSLAECSQSLRAKLVETEGPVHLSQVQSFVETRLGYFWKVRHAVTGEVIGFEEEIIEKINIAYTKREPTCSFTYKSHMYVVDFSQMTITDQLDGQVHSLIKEPVWCRYANENFGYKPLQESISTIIESIFQQGAPGFIMIEGQQCVVDFHSTPMEAYSTTGEHCNIQRRPTVEHSNLTPGVTIRVRGLAENLASAERVFRQTLQGKITTEVLKIQTKMQGAVTRLLLTTITRQYCVQCVYDEDQQVLKLSGTKENVSDVHRLLLQETLKIMSESDAPEDHSVIPPHWEPQTSDIQLCTVEKGSPEWACIENLMKESLTSVRIETIQRIQNRHLWQKYRFFRRVIQERMNGRDINEKELFHGTRSNHPSVIYESEKGFDFRFGSSECMWGQGSYFAVKASYSDNGYAHRISGGSKQLILASVVTGESKFMNKREKLSVPPLKPGSIKERYDTIRATTAGSEVYVVYDHEKAYPGYLITYRT